VVVEMMVGVEVASLFVAEKAMGVAVVELVMDVDIELKHSYLEIH
jgi:hypothetical protein